jgi:hypothetical protein
MIAPHRFNRTKPPTQDRRRLSRYMRRWLVERSSLGYSGSVASSSAGSTTPRTSSALGEARPRSETGWGLLLSAARRSSAGTRLGDPAAMLIRHLLAISRHHLTAELGLSRKFSAASRRDAPLLRSRVHAGPQNMASASIGPPKTESVPPDSLTHRHLGIPRFKPAGICSNCHPERSCWSPGARLRQVQQRDNVRQL